MKIEITDEARDLLVKRGGTMTIDFIRPTGWGKVAEVSVDTNTTNKNLAPYSRIRHPEYRILVTPVLSGIASRMRITTRGRFVKNLVVELGDDRRRVADGEGECWMFRLDGKVALITGSTRGLGWAMAEAMADVGAHVVINGRHDETVMAKTAELSLGGAQASGIAFDVADLAAAVAGVETVVERHGTIDILVNNAGIQHRSPIADFDQAEWEHVMAVNLHAPFALARAAAVHMMEAGFGRIINTGSVMSQIARPTIPAYVASKSGIAGMTRALAVELAPHGVTVNAIGPGYVATEMNTALVNDPEFDAMVRSRTPAARWGRPSEIAAAAVFLASNQASFVNGHLLMVDGGMSVAL